MAPKTAAQHYKSAPSPHKETMLEMRKRILQVIPKAVEVVSYGMPAFKVDDNIVAGLLANKNHVGYYPFSGSVLHLFKKELADYKFTKSAIHVPIDKPLSKTLISKLIKARISQCPVKQGKVDLAKYEKFGGYWKTIGIAAPARRALVDAKLLTITDLKKITEKKLIGLHGMGPSALKILKTEMKQKKVAFAKE